MKHINETASVIVLGRKAHITVTETTNTKNTSHTLLITMDVSGEMRTICDIYALSKQPVFSEAGLCSVGLKQTEATQFIEQYLMDVVIATTYDA
jgi:hypothetical protein